MEFGATAALLLQYVNSFAALSADPAEYAIPIITGVSQTSFAAEGGSSSFLVEGYGVAATYAGAPPNTCRLQPRPGESAWTHVSGFLNDVRTVIELNSTVGEREAC